MKTKFIIILCFISGYLSAFNYDVDNFTVDPALAHSFTYSIVQDDNGYLWVGTSNGLFKYSGFTFQYFTKKDSLSDNFITSSINYNGSVWFGHRTGQLTTYSNSIFTPINTSIKEISSISGFAIDKANALWISTYSSGLLKVGDKQSLKQFKFLDESVTIHTFQFVTENTFLIGSDDGVRYCKYNASGDIVVIKYLVDIPKVKIASIVKAPKENDFYVAAEDKGIFQLTVSNNYISSKTLVDEKTLNGNLITHLLVDNHQRLWASTFGGGLIKILFEEDRNAKEHVAISFMLNEPASNIKCLYQDRDENIWIGNYGAGISKLSNNPFKKEELPATLYGKSVLSMAVDSSYRWVGTEKALLCYNHANELVKVYTVLNGLPADDICALYISNESTLWIGTQKSGLYKLSVADGKILRYNLSNGFLENSITSIAGVNPILWVGTKKGACAINMQKGTEKWYDIQKGGLPHNVVNDIFVDSHKKVWVTTQSNILSYYVEGAFHKMSLVSESGVITLNAITQDNNGDIWVGSNGKGIYKVHNDSILNLGVEEGLFSNYCYSVIADQKGFIWIGHKGGVTRINSTNLSTRSIQMYAGLNENDMFSVNATAIDWYGQVWLGMNTGVLNYNPRQENQYFLPPLLNLTGVRVNDEVIAPSMKLNLPPGKYKVKFDFVGISLKDPSGVKYQYRLVGYDNEWSMITKDQSVIFNGVGYGNYIFELNAASSEGIATSNPLQVEIVVRKPIWSQWWFYVLVSMLFYLLIHIYIKQRERKLRYEKISLEKVVQQRTKEVIRQKEEIELQRDLIQKKNIDITDSIKYARQIQSAIIPSEETLRKVLPEHFLINMPKDIVSGDFCWYAECEGKDVIAITDCTGHGIPGAIMSMLSITLFNEVVNTLRIVDSAKVLEVLREKVISALSQHSKGAPSYDGMNVALCILDKEKKHIQYSGAFHNLLHFHKGELNVIKADRTPIGHTLIGISHFKAHDIYYETGDVFYMYTDGFPDQFGGPNDKKFTNRRILSILKGIFNNPIDKQEVSIRLALETWMLHTEQTDDIAILGFRL
jgi:ligand-binding sensor domain-containing protein/serine phosphatase RsbU (regulator of sigma subunit)